MYSLRSYFFKSKSSKVRTHSGCSVLTVLRQKGVCNQRKGVAEIFMTLNHSQTLVRFKAVCFPREKTKRTECERINHLSFIPPLITVFAEFDQKSKSKSRLCCGFFSGSGLGCEKCFSAIGAFFSAIKFFMPSKLSKQF